MNDKCAAGTGRFVEVMMRILEEDIINILEKIRKEDTEENESLLVRSEDEMEAEDSFRYSYKNNDVIVDKLTGKEFPRN